MFINTRKRIYDLEVCVLISNPVWTRLAGTCFRGKSKVLAGNFCRWINHNEMFDPNDTYIQDQLLGDVEEATGKSRKNSFSIQFDEFIGWSSTDDRILHADISLEPFAINGRATGYKIRADRQDILAPKTKLLTIIYNLAFEANQLLVHIVSMYPGPDIGELVGDVSEREGIVFFGWKHPGEP